MFNFLSRRGLLCLFLPHETKKTGSRKFARMRGSKKETRASHLPPKKRLCAVFEASVRTFSGTHGWKNSKNVERNIIISNNCSYQ